MIEKPGCCLFINIIFVQLMYLINWPTQRGLYPSSGSHETNTRGRRDPQKMAEVSNWRSSFFVGNFLFLRLSECIVHEWSNIHYLCFSNSHPLFFSNTYLHSTNYPLVLHVSSINYPTIHSFIHSFVRSFIHSFIHAFIHSFIHSFHLFIHSFIHSFHSFISFIHSFIHSSIHSFIHSFIHSLFT